MNHEELLSGDFPAALKFPHFPTRMQAFVWRNWRMVTPERLAMVIGATVPELKDLASGMGLPAAADPAAAGLWRQRGYITLIRQNWHLLPPEQLLVLLDWDMEQLMFCLKEDDFLWHKLGKHKPVADRIDYRSLTPDEERQTQRLRLVMTRYFADEAAPDFRPFDFSYDQAVPVGAESGLRMIYTYAATYGDSLLDDSLADYPEDLLKSYGESGINGIWLQALAYNLFPWKRLPAELAGDCRRRLANLRRLTERAARYGIDIYLYFNEPRTVPKRFAVNIGDLQGLDHGDSLGLCTSCPEVLDYLADAMSAVFTAAPLLGGIFTINRSENPTNCASADRQPECPRCAGRNPAEIIAEVITAMERGVHRAKPSARVIAYTWAWPEESIADIIGLLPREVEIMSVSEWGVATECEGIAGTVIDYSISHPGPSPLAIETWRAAAGRGMAGIAKIQINNSWEMCAVPYLPVWSLIEEHLGNLRRAGINDYVLSWTLGGYPSPLIGMTSHSRDEVLSGCYGSAAAVVAGADECFSAAFRNFPFNSINTIYYAPQNYGPSCLLFMQPTGYAATMVGFPYDDLELWRSIYPPDVFERAIDRLCRLWRKGLDLLDDAGEPENHKQAAALRELRVVAGTVFCHFKSFLNQIRFVRARSAPVENRGKLLDILDDEIGLAVRLEGYMRLEPKIGFEASNHYLYTPEALREKVLNCVHLVDAVSAMQPAEVAGE